MRNRVIPMMNPTLKNPIRSVMNATTSRKPTAAESKAVRLTDKPIPKDLAKRVTDKIIKARVKMLFQQAFFGTLITRMQTFSADAWLSTMAVDGKYLYFNHAFVDSLEQDELVFVLAHEVLHLVYDHLSRGSGRDQQVYNCAADYIVNDELIQANVGKFPTTVPGLHDVKYRGWSSEKVYEDLMKQVQKQRQQKSNQGDGGDGGSGSGSKLLDDMLDKLLDEHLTGNEGNKKSDSGDGEPSQNGPAQLSEEERKQLKAEMRQEIINSAQVAGIGNLPAGVQRLVNSLLAPKMDWKALLQSQLNSLIPYDYSYMRVNRKGWDIEPILPGMTEEKMLNIAVALDMSGSISDKMVQEFLSEVSGIMQAYPMYEIRVFCFDTQCYNDKTFSTDNGEDIRTYTPKGGGGTDGGCIFRYLRDENVIPTKLVIFTDGYVGDFGDENYCPTVWIIKGSNVVPPFGTHAYYDDPDKQD